jgi:MFS family permease
VIATARLQNLRSGTSRTFAAFEVRNYRVYFTGQVVSVAGTWMQTVAQGLLVLTLTDSATVLGLVVAMQMLPILLFGLWAGVIADRVSRRGLLLVTQVLGAACAITLGTLVATGAVRLWMVFGLAGLIGMVQAFENPTRAAFVSELVPRELLPNAISLNSVMMNLARIVGPATAALVKASVGLAACFFVNAASFLAVIAALLLIRRRELVPFSRPEHPARLREGLQYVRRTPIVFVPLLVMGIVGITAYNFQVTLLMLAKAFGNEDYYGAISSLQGAGAVVGGLVVASRFRARNPDVIGKGAVVLGATILAMVLAPTLGTALVLAVVLGAVSISLIAMASTILQLGSAPHMRGRVMSLWTIALMGSTAIGGPFVGWFSDQFGARGGLALGGVAAIITGVVATPALRRLAGDLTGPVVGSSATVAGTEPEVAPAV